MIVLPTVCWRSRTVNPGVGKKDRWQRGRKEKIQEMTRSLTLRVDVGADQLPVIKPSISLLIPPATQTFLLDVTRKDIQTCPESGWACSPCITPCQERPGETGVRHR